MKRKLIRQGGGGLTVYLPKRWVDRKKLRSGDTVEIDATDAEIVIRGTGKAALEASIDVSNEPRQFVRMQIMNLYRLGYDKVEVSYAKKREVADVKRILRELLGFTVTHDDSSGGKGVLTVESISEPSAESYESIARRLIFLFEEIITLVKEGDTSEIEERTLEAYRYDHFCKRVIAKQSFVKSQGFLYWAFHLQLIHSIRDAHFLAAALKGRAPSRGVRDLLDEADELLACLKQAHLKKEAMELLPIYEQRDTFLAAGHRALKREDPVVVHHLLDVMRNIYLTASPLFSIISSERMGRARP